MASATALKNILTTARDGDFGAFLVASEAAGLRSELESKGPITVFIPTDDAFARLSARDLKTLNDDPEALRKTARYSIARGALTREALSRLDSLETLGGERIEIAASPTLSADGVPLDKPEIECSNGIVYVVDRVLIPPSLRGSLGPSAAPEAADVGENDDANEGESIGDALETLEVGEIVPKPGDASATQSPTAETDARPKTPPNAESKTETAV